jgi:signal transduction histidine kinase
MPGSTTHDLLTAYVEADREQRVRLLRVGCVLGLVLVPLFWGLDWMVYPSVAAEIGLSRLICDLGIVGVYALLSTAVGRRWIRPLSVAWVMLPASAISWMIWRTEGELSPYYAGLNLVMIIVSLLMPWTAIEVLVVCALTIVMYLGACLLHGPEIPLRWDRLGSNLYFMIATASICITAGFFSARRRFADFSLRHDLDERNRRLAEMDRLKTEFYANISHELRTPLTLILAPLDHLLGRPGLARETRSTLEMIRGNGLRLLRLINDIIEMVRMEGGALVVRRRRLELGTWIPGLVGSVSRLAEMKGLAIVVRPPAAEVTIAADPAMMEKVLLNLLSNAIKFTPAGGTIRVSWGLGDQAWIEVADSGIGIGPDEMPRLFSRFHQVDGSSTRRYRGLGLGLSLSRDLVQHHGGQLTATSEPGRGSVFRIGLPGHDPAEAEPLGADDDSDLIVRAYGDADRQGHFVLADEGAQALGTILAPHHQREHAELILVADDEPDMRRFLVEILRERHRVIAVPDGARALEAARELRPALVLLDLMMPGLDGMQCCRALRADARTCDGRIVLLTARADDEVKLGALQGGADDFLTKPFNSQEVLSRVRNLLENAVLQRRLRARNDELEATLARLRQAEAQLVQSAKMNALGSLTSGLLHEINNPLNYALMAIRFAESRSGSGAEGLQEALRDARDGMTRIGDVISSLRTFAHPEAPGVCEPFPVAQAVELALRFTGHLCQGIVVEQRIAQLRVSGSVNQISMLLVNLISNAASAIRSAGRDGAGRIRISAAAQGDRLSLAVEDDGIGMDQDQAARVFEPFFTTKPVGQGMGLGMAICHTIARNHQGEIQVASRRGVGTTITFAMPLGIATDAGAVHAY